MSQLTLNGMQSIQAFVEPGELFGELAIFAGDEVVPSHLRENPNLGSGRVIVEDDDGHVYFRGERLAGDCLAAIDPLEAWAARALLKEAGLGTVELHYPLLLDPALTAGATYGVAFQMRIQQEPKA